jgi:hypothetical protein
MLLVDELQPGVGLHLRPQRAVHLHRHLAVFARILGGARHVHLREGDLVLALAAQVFVAQALAAQVALGQAFQAVRLVRLDDVALQHRVVLVAQHVQAVVGEDVQVVLDVLAHLGARGVFQPGLQASQHLVHRQLLGRVAVAVRQRDVGRLAGLHREADADDAGAHGVERIGLGVQAPASSAVAKTCSQASRRSKLVMVSYSRASGAAGSGGGASGNAAVPVEVDRVDTGASDGARPSASSSSRSQLRKP